MLNRHVILGYCSVRAVAQDYKCNAAIEVAAGGKALDDEGDETLSVLAAHFAGFLVAHCVREAVATNCP